MMGFSKFWVRAFVSLQMLYLLPVGVRVAVTCRFNGHCAQRDVFTWLPQVLRLALASWGFAALQAFTWRCAAVFNARLAQSLLMPEIWA